MFRHGIRGSAAATVKRQPLSATGGASPNGHKPLTYRNCPPDSFEQTTEAAPVAALDGIMTASLRPCDGGEAKLWEEEAG